LQALLLLLLLGGDGRWSSNAACPAALLHAARRNARGQGGKKVLI
jgi:hypothetical protein